MGEEERFRRKGQREDEVKVKKAARRDISCEEKVGLQRPE